MVSTVRKLFNNFWGENDTQEGYDEELDTEVDYENEYEEDSENDAFSMFKEKVKL